MDINKKIKTLEFKLSKLLNWWLFWAYKSKFHWSGLEFAEHREYVFWDSLRDIDWKTYNKTDTLYVKKYEEERDLNVLFVLDNSKSMEFWSQNITKKELMEEVFYSLAMSAYLNNDNIWAFVFDDNDYNFIEYKKSKENIVRIFQKLDENNDKKKVSKLWSFNSKIEEILNLIYKRNVRNNLIFILTDDIEIKNDKILKLLWRENEIIYINIFDLLEINIEGIWWISSFNLWGDFLNINLSDSNKINKYKKQMDLKFTTFKDFLRRSNVWYLNLNTQSDLFNELLLYFYKVKN